MSVTELYTFIIAMTLLTVTPGLDTVLVIKNTSRGGRGDGCITSLGICLGLYIHATFSAVGVAAVIGQSPALFRGIQLAGACYLMWIGLSGIRGLRSGTQSLDLTGKSEVVSRLVSLREGFLSNVLNPKTAMFYLAFLPQFINQQGNVWLQSLVLASIHFALAMLWQCGLASMLDRARHWLASAKVNYRLQLCSCLMLIGLGFQLVLS